MNFNFFGSKQAKARVKCVASFQSNDLVVLWEGQYSYFVIYATQKHLSLDRTPILYLTYFLHFHFQQIWILNIACSWISSQDLNDFEKLVEKFITALLIKLKNYQNWGQSINVLIVIGSDQYKVERIIIKEDRDY